MVDLLRVLAVESAVVLLQGLESILKPADLEVEVVLLLQLLVAEQTAEVFGLDLLQLVQLALHSRLEFLQFLLEVQDLLAHLLCLLEGLLAPALRALRLLAEFSRRLHYLFGHLPDPLRFLLHHRHQLVEKHL